MRRAARKATSLRLRTAGQLAITLLVGVGCRLSGGEIVPSPWSHERQQQAVLDVVPYGTPRSDVVERLREQQIVGSFGSNDSIFYCDLWRRPNGETWQIDVALLFDRDGKLYDTRVGQAETTMRRDDAESAPAETRSATAP